MTLADLPAWSANTPVQMPLLVGTSVFKAVTALRRRQSTANAAADGDNGTAGPSRPQPVTLEWRSLSCSLSNAKTGVEKQLLSLDGGSAVPGRLLAVMGPSGSGDPGARPKCLVGTPTTCAWGQCAACSNWQCSNFTLEAASYWVHAGAC